VEAEVEVVAEMENLVGVVWACVYVLNNGG
jgi:hypothetical protein